MPYVLAPIISEDLPALWGEGPPYEKAAVYNINSTDPTSPPVQYNQYKVKPHSMAHVDAPGHIIPGACHVDRFFDQNKLSGFYGMTTVLKLKKDKFVEISTNSSLFHWEVSKEELIDGLSELGIRDVPDRLFLTVADYPVNSVGMHDPNYAVTLGEEAAEWLVQNKNFCAFGTSWKSTDFQPGKRDRPIHKIFLSRKVIVYECLSLRDVPAGEYFLSGFPLPFRGASESPVCPVLFTREELCGKT